MTHSFCRTLLTVAVLFAAVAASQQLPSLTLPQLTLPQLPSLVDVTFKGSFTPFPGVYSMSWSILNDKFTATVNINGDHVVGLGFPGLNGIMGNTIACYLPPNAPAICNDYHDLHDGVSLRLGTTAVLSYSRGSTNSITFSASASGTGIPLTAAATVFSYGVWNNGPSFYGSAKLEVPINFYASAELLPGVSLAVSLPPVTLPTLTIPPLTIPPLNTNLPAVPGVPPASVSVNVKASVGPVAAGVSSGSSGTSVSGGANPSVTGVASANANAGVTLTPGGSPAAPGVPGVSTSTTNGGSAASSTEGSDEAERQQRAAAAGNAGNAGNSALSAGAIAGIVVGCCILVLASAATLFVVRRIRMSRAAAQPVGARAPPPEAVISRAPDAEVVE